MAITLDGSLGITSPTYGGATTAEYSVPVTAFKNRIINGAMVIDQRNASSNVGGYSCLDRWYFNYIGTGITASQTTATLNGVVVNVLQIAGAAGNTGQNFNQKIEAKNSYDLVGQNVSVSFWCYQTTGGTFSLQTNLSYANSADNFSSITPIGTANTTSIPNATWTYVSFTVSSLPLGVANGLQLIVFANSPTLTSGVFQFAFVQIEKGSTATSFDYRPYGTELALCQRYFWTWTGGSYVRYAIGYNDTTTSTQFCGYLPTSMRTTPSVTAMTNFTSNGTAITIATIASNSNQFSLGATGTALLVGASQIYVAAGTTAVLSLSAEL